MSPGSMDGTDGNGLKLEKIGQYFQVLMLRIQKFLDRKLLWLPSLIKFI